jgi:hypothetical protein
MVLVFRRFHLFCDGGEPLFKRFDFGFERKGLDILRLALNLKPVYDVALSAEFGKLTGRLLLKLFNVDLEASRGHREFRSQQILVGLYFSHRLRDGIFQAPHGEPHCAIVDERSDRYPDEGRK